MSHCLQCGDALHTHAARRYCSESCKWQARRARDGIPCDVCGEPTGWTRASGRTKVTHKACSRQACGTVASYRRGCRCDECRLAQNAVMREYQREARAKRPPRERTCDQCGADFVPTVNNQVRCSAECMSAWRIGNKARRRGATTICSVSPLEIYERDNWTCGICELPVDPNEAYPEPGSPSLDHIVPISRGGSHEPGNVQCAHLYCNIVKGNRDLEAEAC